MKVAVYIRVSTKEQTTENQLLEIERFCQTRGWEIGKVYSEEESAWSQGHQTQLSRLLKDIRRGPRRYDYLVVFALDRLSRGGVLAMLTLVNSFELADCKVVSIKESWIADSGPMRDVFTSMVAFVARYESDRKSQNTKAGIERKRRTGWTPGRPKGRKDTKPRHRRRVVIQR
jgi:DNA invertase Pin-like site-specific DNA recombinase